jgi:DNA-binding transcriptional MerR regulator
MLIGELADALGIPTQTVRFYERRGLLPEPRRAPNGYRVYDDATATRLSFIRTAQAAGLTLAEIASVVDLRDDGTAPCTHVGGLLEAKLEEVRERRRQLAALEAELEQLVDRSHRLDPSDCTDADICHILRPDGSAATPTSGSVR